MKLSNKVYDILKYIALIALPAVQVFWLTIGKIWDLQYTVEIGATIGAVALLLGSLLQISNYQHNKPYPMDITGLEYIDAEEEAFDEGADVNE